MVVSGCAHGGPRPPRLGPERAVGALVVDLRDGVDPAAGEAALTRAFAAGPIRCWPVDAAPLVPAEFVGAERLARAAEEALRVRRPWLLVRGPSGLDLRAAQDGELAWTCDAPEGGSAESLVEQAHRAVGGDRPPPALAPVATVKQLRALFLAEDYDAWEQALRAAVATFPGDPALRVQDALRIDWPPSGPPDELRVASLSGQEGENELFALAQAAIVVERPDLALRLVGLHRALDPERGDLLAIEVELAGDLGGDEVGYERALAALDTLGPVVGMGPLRPESDQRALTALDLRFQLGWRAHGTARLDLSARAFEDCADLAKRLGLTADLARCRHEEGIVQAEAGRPRLAVAALREAVGLLVSAREGGERSRSREDLARALLLADRPADAREEFLTLADELEGQGDPVGAFHLRRDSLEALGKMGDAQAVGKYARELERSVTALAGDLRLRELADLHWEEGAALQEAEDDEGAIVAFQAALEGYRRLELRLEEGQTLYSLASPHLGRGRVQQSVDYLREALAISRELDDVESVVVILDQLAAMGFAEGSGGGDTPDP